MILYGKISEVNPKELYICAHCVDNNGQLQYVIDDFSLFAFIVDEFSFGYLIERYQKFGKLEIGQIFISKENFNHYYKLYTEGEHGT